MPSAYTAVIANDPPPTFEEFALRCARSFGALYRLRDEPFSAPIPEAFEPSSYHVDRLHETTAERARIATLTPDEAEQAAAAEYVALREAHEQAGAQKQTLRARYTAMLNAAERWTPPTKDHEGLRTFMIGQLREAIDFDCHLWPPPERRSGDEWRRDMLEALDADIERHTQRRDEEIQNTEAANAWLRALRASVKDKGVDR